jgi:dipeptide/tripeptide permease
MSFMMSARKFWTTRVAYSPGKCPSSPNPILTICTATNDTENKTYVDEKASQSASHDLHDTRSMSNDAEDAPTEEEKISLRRMPDNLPIVAYVICAVEFSERASYYGVQGLISNFVNRPLPVGGNGLGAPPRGTQQTGGALGMGTVKANAVNQSFSMLAYALPLLFGYVSDTFTGRFKLICYGVGVFGVAHVLMVAAGAPTLLASGMAKVPYFISLYILSVGAGT